MNFIVTIMPLDYSILIHIHEAWNHFDIRMLEDLFENVFMIGYAIHFLDIDDTVVRGNIGSLQNYFIVSVRDENITNLVYQRVRQTIADFDLPDTIHINFPPVGQERLDPHIKDGLVARFREIQERQDRRPEQQQGWFPWLFPAPERIPNAIRRDPNIEGIRRAFALLDKSTLCQRVMSVFRTPRNTFECAICLDEETTTRGGQIWLSCGHSFHLYCIGINMVRDTTCPYCRVEIDSITRCRPPNAFMGQKYSMRKKKSRKFYKKWFDYKTSTKTHYNTNGRPKSHRH